MMSKTRFIAAAIIVAPLASQSGAAHADAQLMRAEVHGIVRTICRLEFSRPNAPVSGDTIELGQMTQLCNNREGYRIVVQHSAGLQDATFSVDGVEIPLSAGTETVLVDSNEPDFRVSGASLHLANAGRLSALSFRIEPKGIVY